MQLEDISLEHGGSSLQLSTTHLYPIGNQLQVANKERSVIHLANAPILPTL